MSITHFGTDYAQASKPGHGDASKTTKDITQVDKLKKLPFGVLSAHGATHMAFITYGTLVEVHWDKEATDVDLIERTDFEKWAVGPESGYHFFASGAIVAPSRGGRCSIQVIERSAALSWVGCARTCVCEIVDSKPIRCRIPSSDAHEPALMKVK